MNYIPAGAGEVRAVEGSSVGGEGGEEKEAVQYVENKGRTNDSVV